jgi:putative membrane protein insertion efficiency factor
MNKIFINAIIFLIKIYKYFFSPLLGNKCRFLPSCSDYFIECLNDYGFFKGISLGLRRIIKCHPIKFLGGSSGLDLVPKKRKIKNG